jgi:N-methylhydantoinase A/oxoprolinase/acetone carboxylase beta subunit
MILGIDTGGTYTDAVVIDPATHQVLVKSKVLTTKKYLVSGIQNCIDHLQVSILNKVKLVCLSTTLATNALVEGRQGKVGLILIGKTPEEPLPVEQFILIKGIIDIKGRELEPVSDDQIKETVADLKTSGVEALCISGYASVRNPSHELNVKKKIKENWDIPVVCAHELSSNLGFKNRTVTAVLNAGLISIIRELITSVRTVLTQKGLNTRLMIVRGDGSLMEESYALFKPIETILSGPAASILGGLFLSGKKDAVILDMGGTTTDIADVSNGNVNITNEGAVVGGYKTHVHAAQIHTFGIGGDSYIHLDDEQKIQIGPQKVKPLCIAGDQYPHLIEEFEKYIGNLEYELFSDQIPDCFAYIQKKDGVYLSNLDEQIIYSLRESPHSLFYLSVLFNKDVQALGLSRLVDYGLIERISITPTDLLHFLGTYKQWNRDIAISGIKIIAGKMGLLESRFVNLAMSTLTDHLVHACIGSLSGFEMTGDVIDFDKKILQRKDSYLKMNYSLKKPIIAVGGPVAAWLPQVAERLDAELIIPEHAEVANAVGAAVGQVRESVDVLIRYDKVQENYVIHAPWDRTILHSLDVALDYSLTEGRKYVRNLVNQAGSSHCVLVDSVDHLYIETDYVGHNQYVETRISVVGMGAPEWTVD